MSDDNPKTIPFHRISDETEITVRFNALLRLLVENRIISEDKFEDEVCALLKELDAQGALLSGAIVAKIISGRPHLLERRSQTRGSASRLFAAQIR